MEGLVVGVVNRRDGGLREKKMIQNLAPNFEFFLVMVFL